MGEIETGKLKCRPASVLKTGGGEKLAVCGTVGRKTGEIDTVTTRAIYLAEDAGGTRLWKWFGFVTSWLPRDHLINWQMATKNSILIQYTCSIDKANSEINLNTEFTDFLISIWYYHLAALVCNY